MTDLFAHSELKALRDSWGRTIYQDGGHCPVCDRWGRVYPRAINKTMACSLIWLVNRPEEWVDIPKLAPRWLVRSNQLPTLRWWDLVNRGTNDEPKLKHSGMWRATGLGVEFAYGRMSVPERVFTYNAEPVGFSDETVNIAECFETLFDYQQVMSGEVTDMKE